MTFVLFCVHTIFSRTSYLTLLWLYSTCSEGIYISNKYISLAIKHTWMRMLSMWPFKAKEQRCCVDTREANVTLDLQNTDFCLVVCISRKYFTHMYVNCGVLHFLFFNVVFFICVLQPSPSLSCSVFYFVRIKRFVCKPLDSRAVPLWWTLSSERRFVFSVFLIYLVP